MSERNEVGWRRMLGKKLRLYRLVEEKSIRNVARDLHMSERTVGMVERGEVPGVTAETIFRLAQYHGLTIRIGNEEVPMCALDKDD